MRLLNVVAHALFSSFAWSQNDRAGRDVSVTIQDETVSPPRLRSLLTLCIALGLAIVLAILAAGISTQLVTNRFDSQLREASSQLERLLAEANRELELLASENPSMACASDWRARLGLAGIESLLVREFFYEPKAGGQICGSRGLTPKAWGELDAEHDMPPMQVVAARDRAALVIRRPLGEGALAAMIEPRQLLERLSVPGARLQIALISADQRVFLSPGSAWQSEGSPIRVMSQGVEGWPLALQIPLERLHVIEQALDHFLLWLLLWGLSSVLVVGGVNRMIARRASRQRQLETALIKRRFAPVVQPIVNAMTGDCLGVEVLMRWKHPMRGLVAPLEFIDDAERSGMIIAISDLLMRTARDQLAEIANTYPSIYFSFNITPAQLRMPEFVKSLLDIFDGEPIGPQRVLLELTERDLIDAQVRTIFAELRAYGFRIAIDDFGTGHSSLALLQDLPLDRLKIDREFVRTIDSSNTDQPVLNAIIDLSRRLEFGMIAEGVETIEQQAYLQQRGVQALQGYLFSRPLTPIDFGIWMLQSQPAGASVECVSQDQARLDLDEVGQKLGAAQALRRDRWFHLRRYADCMVGSEVASWLEDHFQLTRRQAVRLGQRLVARGWLIHVVSEHDFEDGPFFYRLVSQNVQSEFSMAFPKDFPTLSQILAWLSGPGGIVPGRRTDSLFTHAKAVSGREIVQALVAVAGVSRQDALQCGRLLVRSGRLRHIFDEFGFEDTHQRLYLFTL